MTRWQRHRLTGNRECGMGEGEGEGFDGRIKGERREGIENEEWERRKIQIRRQFELNLKQI